MQAGALVEAALFAAGRALTARELADLSGLSEEEARSAATSLAARWSDRCSGLEIRSFQDSFVMQVRPDLAPLVAPVAPRELEAPLIRTLAVIAYRQPLPQSELIRLRGNKAYDHVRELERMGLISAPRKGRTRELCTTRGFAEYFGLESESPEAIRQAIGQGRRGLGVTPMFESLALRLGLDYLVVNPYRPQPEDVDRMMEIDLLVVSPGYSELVKASYRGEVLEARTGTLSQLKESAELISARRGGNLEGFLEHVDSLLLHYREMAADCPPVQPRSALVQELAEDLRIPVSDEGIPAAPDYRGTEAEIQIPTHQDYSMDILERVRQRCDALLEGLLKK